MEPTSKEIIESYPAGRCPNCGTKIPRDVVQWESCEHCENIFSSVYFEDDSEEFTKTIALPAS